MKALLPTLLAIITTGCISGGYNDLRQSGEQFFVTDAITLEDDYDCPLDNNVEPVFTPNLDEIGYYEVCTSKSSSESLLIHGRIGGSNEICIYPVQALGPDQVFVKPDPEIPNAIWSECKEVREGTPVMAQFPGSTLNAVFIVEGHLKQDMDICLLVGDYFSCPDFSYGVVR